MSDPIAELLGYVEVDEPPPAAWVERWSQGGRDPVAAAWAVSRDEWSMVRLLGWAPLRHEYDARLAAVRGGACSDEHMTSPTDYGCERCADAVRSVVPVPPTLAELLAGNDGGATVPEDDSALRSKP